MACSCSTILFPAIAYSSVQTRPWGANAPRELRHVTQSLPCITRRCRDSYELGSTAISLCYRVVTTARLYATPCSIAKTHLQRSRATCRLVSLPLSEARTYAFHSAPRFKALPSTRLSRGKTYCVTHRYLTQLKIWRVSKPRRSRISPNASFRL